MSIDYQGNEIKLTKLYGDYHDYKNDPDNIDPSENENVEALMRGATIPDAFPNRDAMDKAISDLKFPGYGSMSSGRMHQPDGSILSIQSVEIPRCNSDRMFVFSVNERTDEYKLLDDFVYDTSKTLINDVRRDGHNLVYLNPKKEVVLTRPVRP